LPVDLVANQSRNNVVCREELSPARREELATKLRKITGLPDLKFDDEGILRFTGDSSAIGSESAKELLAKASNGSNVVVIEDATNRSDVAFCRVLPGRWKDNSKGNPPVFIVQIDFADFDQVVGDERALEAFNVGWGFLHELDHIVNDSPDATSLGDTGECEAHINQMRRECDLPERTDYFSTLSPLAANTTFATRLVRLAFEEQKPAAKKKRYWLIWDANVVGGLEQNQIAALR
jgi:NAD(P)-dependent dehydrogenase (short-subunit alcohol dehydrogenase family)